MPLQIRCQHCDRTFVAPREVAGQKISCPRCGQVISVPKLPTASAPGTSSGNAQSGANIPQAIPVAQPVDDAGDVPTAAPVARPIATPIRPGQPAGQGSGPPALPMSTKRSPQQATAKNKADIDALLREGMQEEEAGILLLDASLGPISRVLDGWERDLRKSLGWPLRGHGVVAFCVTRPLSVLVLLLAVLAGVLTTMNHPIVFGTALGVVYALAGLLIFWRGMNWETAGTTKYKVAASIFIALAVLAYSEHVFGWIHGIKNNVVALLQQEGVMAKPKPPVTSPEVASSESAPPIKTRPPETSASTNAAPAQEPPPSVAEPGPSSTASTTIPDESPDISSEPPKEGDVTPTAPSLLAVTDYRTLANRAYMAGNSVDGFDFLLAAALNAEKTIGSSTGMGVDRYFWVPALERPVVTLRWGVGYFYEGQDKPPQQPEPQPGPNFGAGQLALEDLFVKTCSQPGQVLLDWLESAYKERRFGDIKWAPSGKRQKGQGVVHLGAGNATELLLAAKKMRLHCLLVAELKDVQTGAGNRMVAGTQLRLVAYNVAAQETIFATDPPLSSVRVKQDLALGAKPIEAYLRKFDKKLLEQSLKLAEDFELPRGNATSPGSADELRHKTEAAREIADGVVGGVQGGKETILSGLVTIKYLHEHNLLSDDQQKSYYAAIAGEEAARGLAGNAKERRAVIDKWVTRQESPSPVQ